MKRILLTLITVMTCLIIISGQADTTTLTRIGQKAPVFSCKTIDGKVIDIGKLHGKIIMINFFAAWCGPCNLELPVLEKNIWSRYRNNPDFVLLILGREHTEKEVGDFVSSKKFTMPFAPDPSREIFKLYATQNIPRNVLIGKDGNIIYQSMGYSKEDFQKLETFLADQINAR
jgi:peroxiredoxin